MRVIVANFGRGNYLWPQVLERSTVATIEDAQVRPFSLSGDREAYIQLCMRSLKTVRGHSPTRSVASRWFNVAKEIESTHGDIWVHRDGDLLWWTITKAEPVIESLEASDDPSYPGQMVYTIHKPAQAWSSEDRKGRILSWASMHPKAKDFLFTESTLMQLREDNAEYVQAMIEGGDLSPWQLRKAWADKLRSAKQAPISNYTSIRVAALNMVRTALSTTLHSNGQTVERKIKNKEHGFDSEDEFCDYLEGLIADQEGLCALSGLALHYTGELDRDMVASLDRIDSDGHYVQGNLQIVCRFVNRWKSDDRDDNFVRLLDAIRSGPILAQ